MNDDSEMTAGTFWIQSQVALAAGTILFAVGWFWIGAVWVVSSTILFLMAVRAS
jgi:hypothetical protein